MSKKVYNKLVRDKIPEIIRAKGHNPKTKILGEKEYLHALVSKLKEEVAEFETDHSIEELADIKVVIIALREASNIPAGALEDTRRQEAKTNGRFKQRIYLEEVIEK